MMWMKINKFKKNEEVWESVKKEIETVNDNKKIKYWKDLKKNQF